MGDADPQVARQVSPNSLRALYGISNEQNAVMGSSDVDTAEIQIASLFVSSPPFPTSVLPDDYSTTSTTDGLGLGLGHPDALTAGSLRSLSSSLPSSYRPPRTTTTATTTTTTNHSPPGSSSLTNSNGTSQRTPFRAREIPPSHISPTIVPRTTRAADLRTGATPPKIERNHSPRPPPSKEALKKMFANVPGHKRTDSIPVASTLTPSMPPRMTRAAALRIEGALPPKPFRPKPIITLAQAKAKAAEEERAKAALKEAQARTFDGVPGHKRRESFSVSSTKSPNVTPRPNRSAMLRASKDTPPPSSYQCTSPLLVSLYPIGIICFFFLALTRILNSPVTDRSDLVAVHFKFEWVVTFSSWIRARRREFSASIAFSDVRCWRKPPHELTGTNRGATTEPQCDAASCQEG